MRAYALLIILITCIFRSAVSASARDVSFLENNTFDAYMLAPALYRELTNEMRRKGLTELAEPLEDNGYWVRESPLRPGHFLIKILDRETYDFEIIREIKVNAKGEHDLMLYEAYTPEKTREAVEAYLKKIPQMRLAPGTVEQLVMHLGKEPEEFARIAQQFYEGKIDHRYAPGLVVDWMTPVVIFGNSPEYYGTYSALLLDQTFRKVREGLDWPTNSRAEDIAYANEILTMRYWNPAFKHRDLVYCLLTQNGNPEDPDRQEELRFWVLSRMKELGEPYPEADFEAFESGVGLWRRVVRYFSDVPVMEIADLPTQDIDKSRCPYLKDEVFR